MQITRSSIDTEKGSPDWFTGEVYLDAIAAPEGVGLCQREGGPIEELRPGDRVFFAPGENHWHGAAPNRFMSHLAMQQHDASGDRIAWGRLVSDEEYGDR